MTSTEKYETFGKRFLAGLIDTGLFMPFILLQNYYEAREDANGYLFSYILYIICWIIYVVTGHGKWGQTIGKKLMGLKVFRLNEKDVINFKRAFYREAVWFVGSMILLILIVSSGEDVLGRAGTSDDQIYTGYLELFSGLWFILEFVTMFFNKKRRALHDYIAGSVVVDLNELKREQLEAQKKEMRVSV